MIKQLGTRTPVRCGNGSITRPKLRSLLWLTTLALIVAVQTIGVGAASPQAPHKGGTLIYAENFGSFDSFIPVISPAEIVDDEAQVLLFRPLLWIGQKASIEYGRSIAKSITVSKNDTPIRYSCVAPISGRTARRSPPPTSRSAST